MYKLGTFRLRYNIKLRSLRKAHYELRITVDNCNLPERIYIFRTATTNCEYNFEGILSQDTIGN